MSSVLQILYLVGVRVSNFLKLFTIHRNDKCNVDWLYALFLILIRATISIKSLNDFH